jgi:hypothetical protein
MLARTNVFYVLVESMNMVCILRMKNSYVGIRRTRKKSAQPAATCRIIAGDSMVFRKKWFKTKIRWTPKGIAYDDLNNPVVWSHTI